ncbi:MAG: bifunctional DNA-formamidopyrimidine glycosylase/DNA-(apurinic or apyrimidinic site) lyase [Burkholderiales bacterium]
MPELPEVEVTLRGIAPQLTGRVLTGIAVREPRLRWRVQRSIERLAGHRVQSLRRRGKYLLFDCGDGHIIVHLGMSGSLRLMARGTPPHKHDHVDLQFDELILRLRDPRRFGAVLWTDAPLDVHPLLCRLGVEPLTRAFDAKRLHALTRGLRSAIKQTLMDGRRVVGIGNIYASESLFRAGIHPFARAGSLSLERCLRLATAIKTTLRDAIRAGGSSLRDFVGSDGSSGCFQQRYWVYGRADEPCRRCGTPVRRTIQGQRATFYCPSCQR